MDFFGDFPEQSYPKGQLLQRAGEKAQFAYRVRSGCLRSYVIDRSGKEHTVQFAPEGWLISDLNSLLNQAPSLVFIEALEKSTVALLPQHSLEDLHHYARPVLERMNRILMNNIVATNRRLIGMLSASAKDRYQEFCDTYPALVQRLPQKLIASYIGITPEYLSELRRKQKQAHQK